MNNYSAGLTPRQQSLLSPSPLSVFLRKLAFFQSKPRESSFNCQSNFNWHYIHKEIIPLSLNILSRQCYYTSPISQLYQVTVSLSPSCQVSAFLWSGAANWWPRQLPLAIAGIFQISVKTRQIKSETAQLIRTEPELMTEREAVPSNYILINPALMTFSPTVQAYIWSYSAVQCLCVNERECLSPSLISSQF